MSAVNSIMGVEKDFNLMMGDTWDHSFQAKDSTGTPIDLTTAISLTAVVKEKNDVNAPAAVTMTVGQGITITSESGGDNSICNIFKTMPMKKYGVLTYYYSVKAVFLNDFEVTFEYGKHIYKQGNQ